jgi:non-specific serine/threonine protein kinase
MPVVDHVASLPSGRAGWRGGKYSKHCSLLSALTTNVRRAYSAYPLWALGAGAWRRGDLNRASGLEQQSLRLLSDGRMGRTFCVQALAWIAASRNQHERAAILVGAATGLWRSIGTTLESHQPLAGHHRDCERQALQALGEAAYQAAYRRGLDLPAGDVLAYALEQSPGKPPGARDVRRGAADAPGTAGGPPDRRVPQQQADRR